MNSILVEHDPSPLKLEVLGMEDWPLSNEPVSVQEKTYRQTETTFILDGRAEIIPIDGAQEGETIAIQSGDLVTFMPESRCTWHITEAIERHYRIG